MAHNKGTGRDMMAGMFLSTAVAMIFTQLAGVMANIIDGIVTSRYLGQEAYSAVSLLGPFSGTLVLLAGFRSTGSQVVCAQLVGVGKKEEANRIFSMTAAITAGMSALLLLGCVCFPRQLFAICGVSIEKNPAIYPEMLRYLHGYMIGIPALMLIQVLGPMIVMDGGKKLFSLSAAVLCVSDVIGDLLNAFVFHGGSFGMGLATSAAFVIQLGMLLGRFFRGDSYFRFSLMGCRIEGMKDVVSAGSPTFVRKLATILRDLFINRMNLAVALSTAAVAARGVQNDLNTLMFCIGLGLGKTLIAMTGIYYSVGDKQGLKRLFITAARTGLMISGGAGLICFLGAGTIARFYMEDPEAVALSTFSIRCMALGLVLDTLLVAFQNYLQGIQNRKLVNLMNFGERLFIPVLTAFTLGRLFGSRGIMASMAISKALLALMVFALVCARCRRFPRSWEDGMFRPKGFGGDEADSRQAQLNDIGDVMRESAAAERFCLEHGADEKLARWMALFVEEMAGNILQHGAPRKAGVVCVDYRIFVNKGRICLCLRDYCEVFDPTRYFEAHRGDDDYEHTGIRMVMRRAKEVQYFNTFDSNNILLYLD
ncbi:MAG: hypothetical protein IJH25_01825 [Clostridia bacterium]|nr:hypothetical protein [Clostridia bacterium]